jgi:hypothetical protein
MTNLMLLRTMARSASLLRRPLSVQTAAALQESAAAPKAVPQVDDRHVLTLLEHSIAQRRPTQALGHLAQLQAPPETPLLQRLALLLARQKRSRGHALRAFEILRGVYRAPGLKPDDYTQLASIYVLDACLRFRMLEQAMEVNI